MTTSTRTAPGRPMIAAALGSVLLGISVVGLRVAVHDLTPAEIGCARFAVAGLLLAAFLAVRGTLRLPTKAFGAVALGGIFLFTLNPLLFTAGVKSTTVARGALMLASIPLWSMLFARLTGREPLTLRKILGSLITCTGVAAVFLDGLTTPASDASSPSTWGDLLCLAAAACAGAYSVVIKKALVTYDALSVSAFAMLVGACALVPFAAVDLAAGLPSPSTPSLVWLAYVAVLGGAVAVAAWTSGLQKLTPTQGSVFLNLNPIAATAVGALTLHELPRPAWLVGLVLVVLGLVVVARAPR